jgi:hypothetical protein
MSSTKETFKLSGVLRGQGQDATCTIQVIKVTVPGGGTLTKKRVESASKSLPEGVYHLSVKGEPPTAVRYSNGQWLQAF